MLRVTLPLLLNSYRFPTLHPACPIDKTLGVGSFLAGQTSIMADAGSISDTLAGSNCCPTDALIAALKEFISPLMLKEMSNGHLDNLVALEDQARQLVMALNAFVRSLIQQNSSSSTEIMIENTLDTEDDRETERSYRGIADSSKGLNTMLETENHHTEAIPALELSSMLSNSRQEELDAALEEARYVVFNKMPVRMLVFNAEGSSIRLIERPQIYRYIASNIEHAIDHADDTNYLLMKSFSHITGSLLSNIVIEHTNYAILSHTWLQSTPGEVTYANWISKEYNTESAEYAKVRNFCTVAAIEHGITLGWMDTICINKESSSELDESIRSMYKWYQNAYVCIAYLAKTIDTHYMHWDPWFTRGWTLQELIAPKRIKFYGRNWEALGRAYDSSDKGDHVIRASIRKATSITCDELATPLNLIPISRRMQWAVGRHVTREEDSAYSLMGVFNVSITTAYGEGAESAFFRLVREILFVSDPQENVLDIANWGSGPNKKFHPMRTCGLIPSSIEAYAYRQDGFQWPETKTPTTLTRVGIRLPVLLMPACIDIENKTWASDYTFEAQGSFYAFVNEARSDIHSADSNNENSDKSYFKYRVLDRKAFEQSMFNRRAESVRTSSKFPTIFAVLNFDYDESRPEIIIPSGTPCLSVMFRVLGENISSVKSTDLRRVPTIKPISFYLHCKGDKFTTVPYAPNPLDGSSPIFGVSIEKGQLYKHGIVLRTLYI